MQYSILSVNSSIGNRIRFEKKKIMFQLHRNQVSTRNEVSTRSQVSTRFEWIPGGFEM